MDAIPFDRLRSSLDSLKLRFQAANDPDSPHKAWLVHVHGKGDEKPSIYDLADGFNSYREKPSPSDLGAIRVSAIGRQVSVFRRCVQLKGYQRLMPICDDAGRLVDGLPNAVQSRLWCGLPDGTQLMGEGLSRWVLAVFELGNANVVWSSLRCVRHYPSSPEQIRRIFTEEMQLPADADWYATLPDFAAASVQAIDILQSWLVEVPKQVPEAAADDIVKRLETLERRPIEQPKQLTKSEKIRNQRNDFSCKRRTKKSPETWNEIYHAYNKKFPNDKDASPATLRLSHDRNCQKCRTA